MVKAKKGFDLLSIFSKIPLPFYYVFGALIALFFFRKSVSKYVSGIKSFFGMDGPSDVSIASDKNTVKKITYNSSGIRFPLTKLQLVSDDLYRIMEPDYHTVGDDGDCLDLIRDYNKDELNYIFKYFGLKEGKNLKTWFQGDLENWSLDFWNPSEYRQMKTFLKTTADIDI